MTMGAVRANWHLDALDLPDVTADPMQIGKPIDLSKSEAELSGELQSLLRSEARLSKTIECDLKWLDNHVLVGGDEVSCYDCPHYAPYSDSEPRSWVCRLGRAQEDVMQNLRAVRGGVTLENELAAHFAEEIEACAELAEALA